MSEWDAIHERLEAERRAALPEAERVREFREYARGRQRGTLTLGQQRILRGVLGQPFCENVCRRVLGEVRNRLRLARFEVAGGGARSEAVTAFLEELWTLNRLPALSAAVHWALLRDGNHAVGLGWLGDEAAGRVALTRERWWNGKSGMFVAYDDHARPTYAVKEWVAEAGATRRTVWWPERIERYVLAEGGWEPFLLASDEGEWPQAWVDERGEPLGIPVVHFANVQAPNDGPGDDGAGEPDPLYGMSELDGGILGLQDEVNDLHRDITAASRFAGYQMLYATGVMERVNEVGETVPYQVEPGAMLTDSSPEARFGVLPAGSLGELKTALEIKLGAVARMAGVPLHLISGDWPSGEALLRAELPLIDKVETLGAAVGPAWASVAHKATRFVNHFGGRGLDESLLISAAFAPVARRDPLTLALVAERMAPFVSRQERLRILGYGTKEQERILGEMREEKREN